MIEAPWVAAIVSLLALSVSLATMWATLFRRGRLLMTQPTQIFIGRDGKNFDGGWKIYLRFLLYSTGKRGFVVENMSVDMTFNEQTSNFVVWVFGDKSLSRGAGIFVGDQGVVANHHFLQFPDSKHAGFDAGEYKLRVWADVVGAKSREILFETKLQISHEQAKAIAQPNVGIFFDWGPGSRRYISHVDRKDPETVSPEVTQLLSAIATSNPTGTKP